MTVESSTTSVELEGNGSAREFSFSPIKIFDATQLEVVLRDTDGSLTTLARGTGSAAYSVQATFTENEASTGSVRYPDSGGTLLTAGQFLNIRRVVPFKQETNFENQGGYLPEVQEATHDLHTMMALQLQEELSRTVKVAFGSDVAAEDYLSTVAASAATASAAATTATTKAGEASASAIAAAASEVAAEAAKDDAEAALAAIGTSVSDAAASQAAAAASASTATTQATNASNSASSAAASASTATTQATNASNSASTALSAQTAAEAARDATLAAYDNFDDRYLGAKASDPTLDNDGNALAAGSLYFNTGDGAMKVYTGSVWVAAYVSGTDFLAKANNLSDLTNAGTARTNLGLGTMASQNASAVDITGTFKLSGSISPTVSTFTNDWAPTGYATAGIIYVTVSGANQTVSGLLGGVEGRVVKLIVASTGGYLVIPNEYGSSTAANRFRTPKASDFFVYPGGGIELIYSNSRWRVIGEVADVARADGTLPVANGGTGLTSPGTSGNVLTSNGTAWVSSAPAGGGKIAQVVVGTYSTLSSVTGIIPYDNTIPQNTEGTEVLTQSFTPTNASSTLIIDVCLVGVGYAGGDTAQAALFVDTTANALAVCNTVAGTAGGYRNSMCMTYKVSAGSTSSRTYKIRLGTGGGVTLNINNPGYGGVMPSTIKITEVLP